MFEIVFGFSVYAFSVIKTRDGFPISVVKCYSCGLHLLPPKACV